LIDVTLINLQMKFGATRREHPADQAAEGIVDATYQRVAPTWRVEEPGTIPLTWLDVGHANSPITSFCACSPFA
jgi:hypothetical protein